MLSTLHSLLLLAGKRKATPKTAPTKTTVSKAPMFCSIVLPPSFLDFSFRNLCLASCFARGKSKWYAAGDFFRFRRRGLVGSGRSEIGLPNLNSSRELQRRLRRSCQRYPKGVSEGRAKWCGSMQLSSHKLQKKAACGEDSSIENRGGLFQRL